MDPVWQWISLTSFRGPYCLKLWKGKGGICSSLMPFIQNFHSNYLWNCKIWNLKFSKFCFFLFYMTNNSHIFFLNTLIQLTGAFSLELEFSNCTDEADESVIYVYNLIKWFWMEIFNILWIGLINILRLSRSLHIYFFC